MYKLELSKNDFLIPNLIEIIDNNLANLYVVKTDDFNLFNNLNNLDTTISSILFNYGAYNYILLGSTDEKKSCNTTINEFLKYYNLVDESAVQFYISIDMLFNEASEY